MPARILVVDDDPQQRRSLILGLRIAGFQTFEADGGEAALQLMESCSINVVITDMMMPGMNGLHLARRLRFRFPEVSVVLTSGYHLGRRQIDRADLHLLAFVPKPYDLSELTTFLQNKLSHLAVG